MKRPNILMIMNDQHHAGCFGYAGNPDVKTPNIDKLASEGTRIHDTFCQNGVCVPSRVSYMTGQYCHTHGVYMNDTDSIPAHLLSLPRFLQFYDYQTALVGKKHMPNWYGHGWQYERLCYHADAPVRILHYYNYLKKHNLHHLYDDLGDVEKFCLSDLPMIPVEHSMEVWTANEATKYLEDKRNSEKPFFMQVSFERPHPPLTVPEGCPFFYDPAKLTLPPNQDELPLNSTFFFNRNVEMKWCSSEHGEQVLRKGLAAYYSLISLIDQQIGRVLEKLEELGLHDNTIVVFCTDHGDFAGEYAKMAKGWCYDCIHRVPFIWRYPGVIKENTAHDGLAETIDMFPTLCNLLDIPTSKTVQGLDLTPALTEGAPTGHDAVFWEFLAVKTVRTKNYKLSYGFQDGKECGELFDLKADPHEYNNLYSDPVMGSIRDRLLRQLLNWSIRTEQPVNFAPANEPLPPSRWLHGHDSGLY
jgi:arylsulfatase A-like enzyme